MGRCDATFSAAQKQAVADNMLSGATAAETVALAAAGELGVPAFEISETSCRVLGAEAREEARRNPDRLAVIADRALTLTEKALDRVEQVQRPSNADLTHLKRLVQLSEAATHAQRGTANPPRRPPTRPEAKDAPSLLAQLQAGQNGDPAAGPE